MKSKRNKQAEAATRQGAYNLLPPTKKVAVLDGRLGKGIGAVKQRTRLDAAVQAEVEAAKKRQDKPKKKAK